MDDDLMKRYEERMRQFAGQGEHFLLPCEEEFGLWERTKYVGGSALAVGGVAGFIGFGSYSLLLAAAAGAMGYVWSEELRHFLLDHTPAPKAARRSRHSRLHWWLTGEVPQEPEQDTDTDENEHDQDDTNDDGEETPMTNDQRPAPAPVDHPTSQRAREFPAPAPTLPASTFSQVLTHFTPTLDQLFLGTLPDGTLVCCAASDLCHVALAGATGEGKSSILRLLLSQLCKAGADVLLLNPHYTRCDIQAQPPEDWTPFEPYLLADPMACRSYETIGWYLQQIASDVLPTRLERYAHSQPVGTPYFVALDELPAIVAHLKDAPGWLAQILREGRKVGIYLITAAQDFLVSTIAPGGGGGAVRDCYRTAYYVGGDGTTAKVLLDLPVCLLPEQDLGRGTVLLRSSRVLQVKQATLVRVPYVDNQALYRLLGPSTYRRSPARLAEQDLVQDLMAPLARTQEPGETSTPETPASSRYHSHGVGSAGLERRKHQRERRLRGMPPAPGTQQDRLTSEPEPEAVPQDEGLTPDERRVLEAYQGGAKTGMAIKSVTGIAGTRVNECLHKLGPVLGLIDWRPRQK